MRYCSICLLAQAKAIFVVPMKAQSRLRLWQFSSYLRYGMFSSCICRTLVSVCAMKGIPVGLLTQWGKDLTYCLTPFFCLVNWDMHYPGSACRGTNLPSGRLLYIHAYCIYHYAILIAKARNQSSAYGGVITYESVRSLALDGSPGTNVLDISLNNDNVLCPM